VRSIYVFDVHIIEKPPKISSLYGFNKVKKFLFFTPVPALFRLAPLRANSFPEKFLIAREYKNKIRIFVLLTR
jgi:hypothetical protein